MIVDIIADTFVDSNILIYVYDTEAQKKLSKNLFQPRFVGWVSGRQ